MKPISIAFILLIIFDLYSSKFLEKDLISFAEDNEIATITTDDESALCEAVKTLNSKGGTIFIDTPVINLSSKCVLTLSGTTSGGIVGKKQSNDEYPRLDFKKQRTEGTNSPGIKITGSNQFVKYIIIENAKNKGIWITGNSNTIDHIISRYNDASGIQISHGGESNTINHCYAYRNCDIGGYGGGADGFSPKLTAKKTVFNYCYAWDNSDDGWDAFDKEGDVTDEITITHSATWNNGNVNVFTGKYDYDLGLELDKNMWTIQQLMESDSNFESNYKTKKFSYDNAKINGESAKSWVSTATSKMNPNGFKFGSAYTPKNSNIKRTCDYCVVFDHAGKGFDNNNSQKCTGSFTNCVSFNNRVNYLLPYTFAKWDNNWSWSAKKSDKDGFDETLLKPSNANSASKIFYSVRDQIIQVVKANKFPDDITFDKAISSLKE